MATVAVAALAGVVGSGMFAKQLCKWVFEKGYERLNKDSKATKWGAKGSKSKMFQKGACSFIGGAIAVLVGALSAYLLVIHAAALTVTSVVQRTVG